MISTFDGPGAPSGHSKQIRHWSLINTDAVLSLTIAGQRFETIAGQDREILALRRRLQPVELQSRRSLDSEERFHPFPGSEVSGALVSKADNQS